MGTARKLELPAARTASTCSTCSTRPSPGTSRRTTAWRGPAFYREKLEGFVAGYGAVLFLGDSGSGALAHCDLATATLAFTPQVDVAAYPAVARHDLTPARRGAARGDRGGSRAGEGARGGALGSACAEDVAQVARLPASVSAVARHDDRLSIHLKAREAPASSTGLARA
ncbi:hypothetical protein JL722_15175 [Aureococcus anophagefferens]|nr:hypothetical protein JL722_15175 [Aureococcus anophagefferens]